MLTDKVDFSGYTREELIEALESVDDEKYPENAVDIYTLLQTKFSSEQVAIDEKYNEEDGVLENALELIFFPVFSGQDIKKSEMKEKLLRIRKLVVANET